MDVATSPANTRTDMVVPPLLGELFDPANRADPYSRYEELRAAGPLHMSAIGLHLATRYTDCVKILQSADWGHDKEAEQLHPTIPAAAFPDTFLWMEPPDHTRLRGLVTKGFTARRVAELRPRITELVDSLFDAALDAGEFDLIEMMAYPLPLTMICEILGVPAEDHPLVQKWSQALSRAFDPDVYMTAEALAARNAALPEFAAYFRQLVDERRRRPGDDLISSLAAVEDQGDRLTAEEVLGTCITLIIAGHETTVNLVGNGALALLRNPDQLDLLGTRPELIPRAVDELLRYDSPIHMNTRAAKRELVIGGRTFAPGEGVVALIACANRDPDAYEEPDRLDVTRFYGERPVSRHLSFSLGHHYCLGAPLALLEMEIFLDALVSRVRSTELLSATPPYKPNILIRGLAGLRVRFKA
ncbi:MULTISPECIES: cytochrome P450 [unclassified Frankia]|uniref:cytochrome P450 n=1 Tax=unclassified Frankia TaxID=2632575 RepID=UPI002AD3E3CC|nr:MULTISPECIES: cytochrome P450 [unclassified Frankia]